jgi:hypothetical protein
MSGPQDDLFDDAEGETLREAVERHGEAVYQLVLQYAEEEQLSNVFVSDLVFEAALRLRMMAYVLETAKPSGSGLKIELDRCRRELDDTIRDHKKMADEFVQMSKTAIEEMMAEEESEQADEDGPKSK